MPRPPFPQSVSEFQAWFGTDEACLRYLIDSRWPDGYRCPRCGHGKAYELTSRAVMKCRRCGYQASVTAGTVLHATRLPLPKWFWAAYLVATHTPGISAVQLQRQLGLKRYETAWAMLQKLRRAMVRPERDRITGTVEVDDAYVGGLEEGRRGGRQRDGSKAIVVAAVEIRGQVQAGYDSACAGCFRGFPGRLRRRGCRSGKRRVDGWLDGVRSPEEEGL